jgi:hypothetical protein
MEAGTALARDAVTPLPGTTAAALAWREQGRLHVTVIAKATFAFAPGASMARAEPQEIVRAEIHHRNNPARSVRLTSDLVPRLARADVVFTGHAFAPPGRPARILPVRIAVFDGLRPLLEKRLLVEDAVPFERMPIVYERAVAGLDAHDNPLATGGEPNIVDPVRPDNPGGFGPISRGWPVRRRLLGATPRNVLDLPIAEIPDGFDWSYFQAAPDDQRTDLLRGDEWILLEGLHPTEAVLRTGLPGARGQALIHGASASGVPEGQILELRADTLRIDGDEQRCTLVFRQSFAITGEAGLPALRLLVAVTIAGEPGLDEAPPANAIEDPPTAPLEGWIPSSFALGGTALPGAPAATADRPGPRERTATIDLPFDADLLAFGTLPFVKIGPADPDLAPTERIRVEMPTLPAVPEPDEAEAASTEPLTAAQVTALRERLAPFPLAPPGAPRDAPDAPIPGAPWSPTPAEKPPPDTGLYQTLAFVDAPPPTWTSDEATRPHPAHSLGEMALREVMADLQASPLPEPAPPAEPEPSEPTRPYPGSRPPRA